MVEDATRKGLPTPDESMAREYCLGKGAHVPDPATLKDFFRFQASIMRGKIDKKIQCWSAPSPWHVTWLIHGLAAPINTIRVQLFHHI
jgi:hypothetical protein